MTNSPTAPQIIEWLSAETGMNFPDVHNIFVAETALRLSAKRELSLEDWFASLPWNTELQNEFINEVTIAETYFFRDEKQFKLLDKIILPEILARRKDSEKDKPVRFWSASCATGEEAVSLAALAHEALYPDCAFHVMASDINTLNFQRLQTGLFPLVSFREDGSCFHSLLESFSPRTSSGWMLPDLLKSNISLERANVLTDTLSLCQDSTNSDNGFDIVFFRNTLLYMKAQAKNQALDTVVRHMKKGAFLFVSSTEVPAIAHPRLCVRETDGSYYFVLCDGEKPSLAAPPKKAGGLPLSKPLAAKGSNALGSKATKTPFRPAADFVADSAQVSQTALFDLLSCLKEITAVQHGLSGLETPADGKKNKAGHTVLSPEAATLLDVLQAVNSSCNTTAAEKIRVFEQKSGENEITRYLAGLTSRNTGDTASARQAFNRAIAHNPAFWPAWFSLAMLDSSMQPRQAVDSFRECIRRLDMDGENLYGCLIENFDREYFKNMSLGMIRKLEAKTGIN